MPGPCKNCSHHYEWHTSGNRMICRRYIPAWTNYYTEEMLLDVARIAYQDIPDDSGEDFGWPDCGDTLAEFIRNEVASIYHPHNGDMDNSEQLARAFRRARDEMDRVSKAFDALIPDIEAREYERERADNAAAD